MVECNQIAIGFHKKILFEREASRLHLSFDSNWKHSFEVCYMSRTQQATEMTKIWLK